MLNQIAFFTALRDVDSNLVGGLKRKCFFQKLLLCHGVRNQNKLGYWFVVVKLAEESAEHLCILHGGIGTREVSAVAPILPGPEKEDLNADLPAL